MSDSFDPELSGKRIAFLGKLGGVSRREASQLVRDHGGVAVPVSDPAIDIVVLGAEESPLAEADLLDEPLRRAAASGDLQVLTETELWQRLGLVEAEQAVRRLYTPAMLADLLGVSVRVIRMWHRRGLIIPARTAHRLPYFDFQEIATARRLAELMAAGASPQALERRLSELAAILPNAERPLTQLGVLVEGKQLLLRQGEGLIEPGGQLRIDFDALEGESQGNAPAASDVSERAEIFSIAHHELTAFPLPQHPPAEEDPLLVDAYHAEEEGDLTTAIDCYHAILARDGIRADISFQLGELLYRSGQIEAARERYYVTIELDESFVEARASLGCVLAETGRLELAVAAFEGTLQMHDDYPDVHYNLARVLDDLGRADEAEPHWQRFLQLAPESPWADEARSRLELAHG